MKHSRKRPAVPDALVPWLFLLPSLVTVSLFILFPFADVVRRSFFSAMGGQFVGLKNYRALFANRAFQLAAWNTLRFTLVCIPLLLGISLLLAVLLNAVKERRGLLKTSFLIPLTVPAASVAVLWQVFFHPQGLLNRLMHILGLPETDWLHTACAFAVLVFTYLWKNIGYDMVLWLSGITAIPDSWHEAAQLDGAGPVTRFFRITLPNLVPTVFTITVLSLLNSFKVFREAYLISGSYPQDSIYLLQHLFNNWFLNLDVDKMCAGAVLLAVLVFVLIAILQWITERSDPTR